MKSAWNSGRKLILKLSPYIIRFHIPRYSADSDAWSNNFNTIFWSDVHHLDASGNWLPVVLNRWYDNRKKKSHELVVCNWHAQGIPTCSIVCSQHGVCRGLWTWRVDHYINYFQLIIPLWCHMVSDNTLRPRQNGRHFTDAIFKCIFFNENVWILNEISLKFVPKGPIDNIPALV